MSIGNPTLEMPHSMRENQSANTSGLTTMPVLKTIYINDSMYSYCPARDVRQHGSFTAYYIKKVAKKPA